MTAPPDEVRLTVAEDAAGRRPVFLGEGGERWLSFALSVFIVLLFAGGWTKPLTGDGTAPIDSPLIRSLYYPGYLAGFALAALRLRETLAASARAPLVWALVAFAFVSVAWSIDPAVSERRALALLLSSFAAAAVGAGLDWRRLTLALAVAFGLMGLGSLAAGSLAPAFGRMQADFPGAWSGLFVEKNGLGGFEAIAAVVSVAAILVDRPRWALWAGAAALACALVLLSTSKTALVALAAGLAALGLVVLVRRSPVWAIAATFLAVAGAGVAAAVVALAPNLPLTLLGKDATLTGRTRIWAAVMRQIALRPRTGYGYGAIWSDASGQGPAAWIVRDLDFRPTYAHNGWLDVWLALGLYAVWLWAAALAVVWGLALRAGYTRRAAFVALPLVAMFTLTSFSESQVLAYNDIDWMLFVMLAVRLAAPERP